MEGEIDRKHKVSFTELPPEIRNMIYIEALVADGALEIQDLHPDEYQEQLEAGSCKKISLYKIRVADPRSILPSKLRETTYSLVGAFDDDVPLMAMLSLDRQTRKEAMPIFYGLNTFFFRSTNCVVPFMLDRTAAAVKLMESFEISLCLEQNDGLSCNGESIAGCDTWIQILTELGKFEDLRLKKLVVDVDGQCNDLNYPSGSFNFESPTTKWIPALCENINGLEMLGITYACGECTFPQLAIADGVLDQIKEDLWRTLAPKMLKKIGDDHDADTLQQRRILDLVPLESDVSSVAEDVTLSNASQIGSESDSGKEDKEEEDIEEEPGEGEDEERGEGNEDGEEGDNEGDDKVEEDGEEALEGGDADVGNSEAKDAVNAWLEEQRFRKRSILGAIDLMNDCGSEVAKAWS